VGGVIVVAALRGGWCLLGDFMGTLWGGAGVIRLPVTPCTAAVCGTGIFVALGRRGKHGVRLT